MHDELAKTVRITARAMARHGFVHAYGHCSARIDEHSFLVAPPKPLGLVRPGEACTVVPIDGALPEGVLGEVRIHREIYRRRPDIGGVVRAMPPNAMFLASMMRAPKPRHGFGAYFWPEPPLWRSPQLLRDDQQAAALAEQMGNAPAILMRGNGTIVVGATQQQAAVLTFYFEDMCRHELAALAVSQFAQTLTADEAAERATWTGGTLERMWSFLTAGDPEAREKFL